MPPYNYNKYYEITKQKMNNIQPIRVYYLKNKKNYKKTIILNNDNNITQNMNGGTHI